MKKHLLYFLLFALALGSCKKIKKESVMENADESLPTDLSLYQSKLTGAKFGWKGYLLTGSKSPTEISVATFLFFFKDNRVTMSADYVKDEKEQQQKSAYCLKRLQRPTLIFDTYSILHKITDPTPAVFGGVAGRGHLVDFEFAFLSANADTIKLEGTFYKNKLYLIRSKSAAPVDNLAAYLTKDKDDMSRVMSNLKTYFKPATINGINYDMINYDSKDNVISFVYTDSKGDKNSIFTKFFVAGTSLVFFDPVNVGNKTLTHIKDISYDKASNLIKATTSYGGPFQIKEAKAPLYYDVTTAEKYIAHPNYIYKNWGWTISTTGFTVESKVDAYDIRTIPRFRSIWYMHKYDQEEYQIIMIVTILPDVKWYGIYVTTTIKEGKIFFTKYLKEGYGLDPVPAAIKPKVDNVMNSFLTEKGFYVIQTSEKTYDLVAANDARSWISFE